MANLQQYGENIVTIWDLNDPSGIAQLQISSVGAREFMDRAPARYVEFLTAGQTPGPKTGANRIIIDSRVSWRSPFDHTR
jgi:hypothetical protein